MILLPSRGRPESLQRFFDAYLKTESAWPGAVLLDEDDSPNYTWKHYPVGWMFHVEPRTNIRERINKAFDIYQHSQVYGLMFDDLEPKTPYWTVRMREATMERGIAWPDDELNQKCTIPFVRGDIARAVGFLACPVVKHLYIDTFWGDLAEALKINGLVPEVKIKHHWDINDKTHNERQDSNDDGNYYTFKKNELPDIARRIAAMV